MTCSNEQYETVCKGEFAEINKKLDTMDEALRGNGKPGIQVRLDRLEQDKSNRSKVVWFLMGIVSTVAGSVATTLILGWV
jgi:hypothetical protein